MTCTPKITFHLGFQKTGTTSIQALLNANQSRLPNVAVRAYGYSTKDLRVAGRNYCAAPDEKNKEKLVNALDNHFAAVRSSGKPFCLISDENILGRVPYSESGDVVSWAEKILPIIESCSVGTEISFHFYTRNAKSWLQSIYRQSVKRARVTSSFDQWIAAAPFSGQWPDWDNWKTRITNSVSAPVIFTSMDAELNSGAILGTSLLESVGVSKKTVDSLTVVSPKNLALSDTALKFMRFVNRLPLKDQHTLRISERVEQLDSRIKRQ